MDNEVLEQKIESLRRCLKRIADKKPQDANQLVGSLDLQDIITVNLERAVQLCVDIAAHLVSETEESAPATMSETISAIEKMGVLSAQTSLRIQKAIGFRNIAVHEYDKINWNIVFEIVTHHLGDFKNFIKEVSQWLGQ